LIRAVNVLLDRYTNAALIIYVVSWLDILSKGHTHTHTGAGTSTQNAVVENGRGLAETSIPKSFPASAIDDWRFNCIWHEGSWSYGAKVGGGSVKGNAVYILMHNVLRYSQIEQ